MGIELGIYLLTKNECSYTSHYRQAARRRRVTRVLEKLAVPMEAERPPGREECGDQRFVPGQEVFLPESASSSSSRLQTEGLRSYFLNSDLVS